VAVGDVEVVEVVEVDVDVDVDVVEVVGGGAPYW
jgi:hypothetical protein